MCESNNRSHQMQTQLIITTLYIASVAFVVAQDILCYPVSVQTSSHLYVAFESNAYKYALPSLHLETSKHYDQYLCTPGSVSGQEILFAGGITNTNSTIISSVDLSVMSQINQPAPYTLRGSCISLGDEQYCYNFDNGLSTFQRVKGFTDVLESISLPKNATNVRYLSFDPYISGRIQLTTYTCQYRNCGQMSYYAIAMNPLRIVRGPFDLPNSEDNYCTVYLEQCTVPVLLDVNIRNDIASWIWAKNDNGLKINIQSFDPRCNQDRLTTIGESLPQENVNCDATTTVPSATTTSASITTSVPTTTIPITTLAPTTATVVPTTNAVSTTVSPTTTTVSTTTTAPTQDISGDNTARQASCALRSKEIYSVVIMFTLSLLLLF
jgi:hypothetical protein